MHVLPAVSGEAVLPSVLFVYSNSCSDLADMVIVSWDRGGAKTVGVGGKIHIHSNIPPEKNRNISLILYRMNILLNNSVLRKFFVKDAIWNLMLFLLTCCKKNIDEV